MRRLVDPPLPTIPSRESSPLTSASRHATPALISPSRVDDVPLDASRFDLMPAPSLSSMNYGSQANDPMAALFSVMGGTSTTASASSATSFVTSSRTHCHTPVVSQWVYALARMASVALLVVLFIFWLEPGKYDTGLRERWSELAQSPSSRFGGVQQIVCYHGCIVHGSPLTLTSSLSGGPY